MTDELAKMTLREKQEQFTLKVSYLIRWAFDHGYTLSFGDAYRNPKFSKEQLGQDKSYFHDWSFHCKRLAVDFNLFKNGEYLTKSEDYKPLADYWKSIGGSAGIDWKDGNHFSLEEGKK
jgi:hypothetical protein